MGGAQAVNGTGHCWGDEALRLRAGLMAFEISLGCVRKTTVQIGDFNCAIGLIQDLFRVLLSKRMQ